MNYEFIYNLINKIWINTEDIQKLCNCSRNGAMAIRKEVEEKVKEVGHRLPTTKCRVVPATLVLDYLGIDIDTVLSINNKKKALSAAIATK